MADGEEDGGQKGQRPQPQQANGCKKVVVGVCVMEKKVGAHTDTEAMTMTTMTLLSLPSVNSRLSLVVLQVWCFFGAFEVRSGDGIRLSLSCPVPEPVMVA